MPSKTHTLELPGLREDIARDFLASVGLLRLMDLKWPAWNCKLAWNANTGHPIIQTIEPLPHDWCDQLVCDIKSLEAHSESPLFHGEIIKTDAEIFRTAILNAIRFANFPHPLAKLPELMFAAYGSQIPDPKTGMIEPTLLSFANGQSGKSLLRDARELIRKMDSDQTKASLLGTAHPVSAKAFRWMPQEYRPAAHRAHDPGAKVKGDEPTDYPSLNILAFFGISGFPTISTAEGGETSSFQRTSSGWSFCWPIWNHAIGASEVVSLLTLPKNRADQPIEVLRIWKSSRLVAEKSVYFAPATLA